MARLPRLTDFSLSRSPQPAALGLPPSLRRLQLMDVRGRLPIAGLLDLRQAPQLTLLQLRRVEGLDAMLPAGVASLRGLRHLHSVLAAGAGPPAALLPGGRARPELAWLSVPAEALAALGLSAIDAGLRRLSVLGFSSASIQKQAAILRWAARHPSLRRSSLPGSTHLATAVALALTEAGRRAPRLAVDTSHLR